MSSAERLDLERELRELAGYLDAPEPVDLAARVVAAVPAAGSAVATPSDRRRRLRARVAVAVAALAAALGLAVAAPAVADWLGVRGVRIRGDRPAEPVPTTVAGATLDLGRPVASLAAAGEVAGFEPLRPSGLGGPSSVWVDERVSSAIVTSVHEGGLLISQFEARLGEDAILEKFAGGAAIERLTIDGDRAVWIDGVHEVGVLTEDGYRLDRLRLSDRVLLLERDGLTVRIETTGGRDRAVAVARSLR